MKRDDELNEEVQSHLNMAAEDRIERGEPADEAAANVRREFGNQLLVKEVTRQMWGFTLLERVAQDLQYALRQLWRNPGFAAVAIVSLALGIGANTAIFSILNALLLRPLPVAAPDELFILRQQSRANTPQRFSYPMFQNLRDASPSVNAASKAVAAMSRITRAQASFDGSTQSELAPTQLVSGEFFPLLGLSPALGRMLTPADNQTMGGHPVAVLSHGYWQRHFAGSPDVLGRNIRLNGAPFTIVGVGPEGFRGVWLESPVDVWVPLMMQADVHYSQNFSSHDNADPERAWVPQEWIDWLDVLVRTRPETAVATRETLNAAFLHSMEQITGSLRPENQRYFRERTLVLEPVSRGLSNVRDRFATPLVAMMALVVLVLLIACANTANLLMARAEGRRREMAVRLSIGADRGRVIQQLLTESFLLAGTAAALGLMIASWAGDLLVRMELGVATGPTPLPTQVDWRVLGFTIMLATATGLLFGLAPAFRAAKTELAEAMKTSSRSVSGRSRFSPAKFLVAAQVALSLLVVAGAGLFSRSLNNLAHVQLGFDRQHVASVWINPRAAGFDAKQLPALYRQLVERVEAIPGVQSAAISMCGLVTECRSVSDGIRIPGLELPPGQSVALQNSFVGSRYFATIGARVLEGREFDDHDVDPARQNRVSVAGSGSSGAGSGRIRDTRSVIINQAAAQKYYAGHSAVGQHFTERMGRGELISEIVGVVEDARINRVREPAAPMAYYPLQGALVYAGSLEVRAAADPESITAELRKAVAEVAPNLPVERITMLTQQVDRSLNQERLIAILTALFGALALGLACFGLYGVMSYGVTRRVPEIGVRMALGARPADVLWTILKEALWLIALGLAVGVPVAILAGRSIGPLLYEVSGADAVTLAASVALLAAVAMGSGLLPAWRASRVSPVVALRNE